jgi:hypothetical protein
LNVEPLSNSVLNDWNVAKRLNVWNDWNKLRFAVSEAMERLERLERAAVVYARSG